MTDSACHMIYKMAEEPNDEKNEQTDKTIKPNVEELELGMGDMNIDTIVQEASKGTFIDF